MGRKKDLVRKYFISIDEKRQSCKFCLKEYNINVNKMKLHLLKCLQCPKEIKKEFKQNNITQMSTFDVVSNDISIDGQVQPISNNYPIVQSQIQKPSTFRQFFDNMDKVENVSLITTF